MSSTRGIPLPIAGIRVAHQPFHVTAKPVGPACNLGCGYCYYLSKEQLIGLPGLSRLKAMSDVLLVAFIKQYIEAQPIPRAVFTWHGGEPTLLGLEFFRKVVRLQRELAPPGFEVDNDLQTNGVLLDDAWCVFLRDERFLVGLSIDGPREMHDAARPSQGGQPTFDRVYAAAKRLQHHGASFNTLTVVSPSNVGHASQVYDFLTKDLGSTFLQFLPCAEHRDFATVAPGYWDFSTQPSIGSLAAQPRTPGSTVTDWSIAADEWGGFLSQLFDRWYESDVGRIRINWFESWIAQWGGSPAKMCVLAETCGQALAVELDGGVYSCDQYVYPEYRLGNISPEGLATLADSDRQNGFGRAKRDQLPLYCHSCEYNFACHGECPRRRFLKTPDGELGLNYFCSGYKRFFAHAGDRIASLASSRYGATRRVRAQGTSRG